jgi:hypothetical protein
MQLAVMHMLTVAMPCASYSQCQVGRRTEGFDRSYRRQVSIGTGRIELNVLALKTGDSRRGFGPAQMLASSSGHVRTFLMRHHWRLGLALLPQEKACDDKARVVSIRHAEKHRAEACRTVGPAL